MSKVFIVNKASHDHSDAERFGELVFLTEGAINRYATTSMFREFIAPLNRSSPEDYILPTSLTIMNIIACTIFGIKHKKLNLLIYKSDKKGGVGRYIERRLNLEEVTDGLSDQGTDCMEESRLNQD